MNKKRAFVDKILLGFLLIAMSMVFIGTISDELKVRNKYTSLKKVLQNTVLSASKYYTYENNNTDEAEVISLGIIGQTPLGDEIKDSIAFTWDFESIPNNVKAKLPLYRENLFWFRFVNLDFVDIDNLEAKANITEVSTDELPIVEEVSNFMPFAINGCGSEDDLIPGESVSFVYKSYGIYDPNDKTAFYGLVVDEEPDRTDGSQDGFAHFKNEVLDFNSLLSDVYLVDTDQNTIENDAQQLASVLEVHKYNEAMNISVALLDCNSTKDNISISNLVDVSMTNIYCGSKATLSDTIDDVFENETGFESVIWVNWVESKDCSQSGLFRIDVDISIPKIETVILEY